MLLFERVSGVVSAISLLGGVLVSAVRADPPPPAKGVLSLKLGATVAPDFGGSIGVDYTIPRFALGSSFLGRVDGDLIYYHVVNREGYGAGFSLNGAGSSNDTSNNQNYTYGVTVNQILIHPRRVHFPYFGGGVGYYGSIKGTSGNGFGGKVFVGTDRSATIGVEAALHLARHNPLGTVQLRFRL